MWLSASQSLSIPLLLFKVHQAKSPGRTFPPHLLLQVEPFSDFRLEDQEPFPARLDHLTTPFDLLLSLCGRWRVYHEEDGVTSTQIWFAFNRMIHSLYSRGFLSDPRVLVHSDLNLYSLLAEIRSATEIDITGVIDWDSAIIAPEFVAYWSFF